MITPEEFSSKGGGAAVATPEEGLTANTRIVVKITGTRGAGPVEMIDAVFNWEGQALEANGEIKSGAFPLDLTAVGGVSTLPAFPVEAYASAQEKGDHDLATSLVQEHSKALAEAQNGGAMTVEEGIIDSVLSYAYENLSFQPIDADPTKFIVSKGDVVLTKDTVQVNGDPFTEYTVRLASRFGAQL